MIQRPTDRTARMNFNTQPQESLPHLTQENNVIPLFPNEVIREKFVIAYNHALANIIGPPCIVDIQIILLEFIYQDIRELRVPQLYTKEGLIFLRNLVYTHPNAQLHQDFLQTLKLQFYSRIGFDENHLKPFIHSIAQALGSNDGLVNLIGADDFIGTPKVVLDHTPKADEIEKLLLSNPWLFMVTMIITCVRLDSKAMDVYRKLVGKYEQQRRCAPNPGLLARSRRVCRPGCAGGSLRACPSGYSYERVLRGSRRLGDRAACRILG